MDVTETYCGACETARPGEAPTPQTDGILRFPEPLSPARLAEVMKRHFANVHPDAILGEYA